MVGSKVRFTLARRQILCKRYSQKCYSDADRKYIRKSFGIGFAVRMNKYDKDLVVVHWKTGMAQSYPIEYLEIVR